MPIRQTRPTGRQNPLVSTLESAGFDALPSAGFPLSWIKSLAAFANDSRPSILDSLPSPMDQPPSPPKPHRGAPRGNKNALKYGFYARHFDKVDLADLKAVSFDGLNDEITMLRVFMRRLIDRYQSSDDLASALAVVRALSVASFSLARLVHLQYTMEPSASDELHQAIDQVITSLEQERAAATVSVSAPPLLTPLLTLNNVSSAPFLS